MLEQNYIVGLVDGEGSFTVYVRDPQNSSQDKTFSNLPGDVMAVAAIDMDHGGIRDDIVIATEKKPALDFDFEFTIQYGETAGGIVINGTLYYSGDKKELDSILEKALKFIPEVEKERFYTPILRPRRTGKPL